MVLSDHVVTLDRVVKDVVLAGTCFAVGFHTKSGVPNVPYEGLALVANPVVSSIQLAYSARSEAADYSSPTGMDRNGKSTYRKDHSGALERGLIFGMVETGILYGCHLAGAACGNLVDNLT